MKKTLIVLLSIFFLNSCEDAIDIRQPGELDPDRTFETVSDLQLGLNAVYSAIGYNTIIALNSIWTDEVAIGFANGGQGLDGEYSYVMNSGSFQPNGIWASNYLLINYANRIIEAGALITPDADEVDAYNNILAQARALRAFGHFQLLTYFSTDLSDDDALGVILMDYVPSTSDQSPRSTNGEVFELINADLDFASANLDSSAADVKYITNNFITAFRARMALYRKDYTNAQIYAQQLIDAVPLATRTQYPTIWTDLGNNEVIFKLERTTGNATIGGLWFSVDETINGSPFYEVGRALFNTIKNGDVRRNVIVGSTSVVLPDYDTTPNYGDDILLLNKYPGSEGTERLNDIKVFRVSEMYFIKAECQVAAGNLSGAAQTLQTLRAARFTAATLPTLPSYASATEAWADILAERRIEFAFEGYRYVDMKRLGTLANKQFDRYSRDCQQASVQICTISPSDYRMTLPIPAEEIQANSAIASQQNPGYN